MKTIEPIGAFFELDAEGCIINPTARDKVAPIFWPAIDAIIAAYRREVGSRLHAIFLRGSVPRGMSVDGVSDLDVVGLMHQLPGEEFIRWAKPTWAEEVADDLVARHPFLQKIDFAIAHRDAEVTERSRLVRFVLKTQGLCIWGVDDTVDWPSFKIDRSIAFHYRWLASELVQWRTTFSRMAHSPERTIFLSSLAKTVLRAGFELVMEREGRFTVDLYCCLQCFGAHYPQHAQEMEDALLTFLNAEDADENSTAWIEVLVPFLADACESNLHF